MDISKDSVNHSMNLFFQDNEIDILSIDIGGFDDLILEKVQNKPKIIIIKSGIYWSPILANKVSMEIMSHGINQPLTVLIHLAKNQGYTAVSYTGNVIFVRNGLIGAFNEIVKDPVTLWMDAWLYFSEKYPSYISWIVNKRASNDYIHKVDSHLIPNLVNQ